MTEFSGLEVGKPSPFPAKPNFDGGYFEADENGFLFLLYIQGITAKEKRSLKNEIIRVRTIREDNKLLMMIRFGTSPIIFELSFDPTLYRDGRAYDLVENVNTVQIIGIDSKDNKLQLLRFVSVPAGLLNLWKECWQSAAGSSNFSQDYNRWLNSLYATYSVVELWDVAKDAGTFGGKAMNDLSTLMNTTQVAELLAALTGDKWDRHKVHLYYKRGTKEFPDPDERIGGKPHWYRETIEKYVKETWKC